MAQKITNKTTDLFIGTILKVINVKENTPFQLNKFYQITDGDGVGALFIGGYSDIEFSIHELGNYFEIVDSIDDVNDLEVKAFQLKEAVVSVKEELKPLGLDIIEMEETIIQRAIERINVDKIELQFICDNINITMVERCSCCGKVLMPDDECYSDELNDNDAALCDHCSIYNDQTDMYQKSVHQDVIEKLTGYKFSPHLVDVDSKIEEFNYWLNKHEHRFGYTELNNKDLFLQFVTEFSDWNTCDCCGLIEKSTELKWLEQDELNKDEQKVANFLSNVSEWFVAVCDECINKAGSVMELTLHDIVLRIRENQMIYREGDLVILNYDEQSRFSKVYIDSIVSVDVDNKTYKTKEGGDKLFKEEDFYDIANQAYLYEYTKFISKYNKVNVDVIEIANIEEIEYKEEFIEYLKSNGLPYSRFLTPKFNIGDEFKINFNHYKDNECTTHQIARIDKSFDESDEIVYWSDEFVYITESELEKQKNFKNNTTKLYNTKIIVEYGLDIEIIEVLQNLELINSSKDLDGTPEMIVLQSNISTEDFSSIEIVLNCEIDYIALERYLISKIDEDLHDEVTKLLEVIKEAKADNHTTLHLYDC